MPAGSRSTRNRNSGLTSSRRSAASSPASKPPASRPARFTGMRVATSAAVTGRRKARRMRPDRIASAQAGSSAARAGRQVRMVRRLGVSPAPVASNGPAMVTRSTNGW